MSHFTNVKTQIKDIDTLIAALRQLGYAVEQGEALTLRGYRGNTTTSPIKVAFEGRGNVYDLGVVAQDDGTYALVSDWWGIRQCGHDDEKLIADINQAYSYQRVVKVCEAAGYTVDEQTTGQNGEIQLTVSAWA